MERCFQRLKKFPTVVFGAGWWEAPAAGRTLGGVKDSQEQAKTELRARMTGAKSWARAGQDLDRHPARHTRQAGGGGYAKAHPTSPAQHQTRDRTGERAKKPTVGGHLAPSVALGGSWGRLGAVLGGLGAVLGRLGAVLGPSWGRLGAVLGRLGAVLGGLWPVLGRLLGPFRS